MNHRCRGLKIARLLERAPQARLVRMKPSSEIRRDRVDGAGPHVRENATGIGLSRLQRAWQMDLSTGAAVADNQRPKHSVGPLPCIPPEPATGRSNRLPVARRLLQNVEIGVSRPEQGRTTTPDERGRAAEKLTLEMTRMAPADVRLAFATIDEVEPLAAIGPVDDMRPSRRREFHAGRLAAHRAVAALGAAPRPIGSLDGVPTFGTGLSGSIAHSLGLALAGVTSSRDAALGVDVEGRRLSARGGRLFHERSVIAWIDAAGDPIRAAERRTVAFAAKEAAYKACAPWGHPRAGLRGIELSASGNELVVAAVHDAGAETERLHGAPVHTASADRWLCAWVWVARG